MKTVQHGNGKQTNLQALKGRCSGCIGVRANNAAQLQDAINRGVRLGAKSSGTRLRKAISFKNTAKPTEEFSSKYRGTL